MEQIDLISLVLGILTLVLVGLLWLRQSRSGQAEGLTRLEELLREQERVFRRELAEDRQAQERRFAELQRQITEDAGRLRTELVERFESLQKATAESLSDGRLAQQRALQEQSESLRSALNQHRESFEQRQAEAVKSQQQTLIEGINAVGKQVNEALGRNTEELGKRVQGLTDSTDKRLQEISGQVDKRLSEGFEKTTETFTQVLSHLTRIDEAQKKITELSSNVVSLQEVLADKRSRGAFGEVQLTALVRNLMPESSFALQYQLSNDKRVDCMLFLPEPTGNIAVDAKFPLESFRRMTDLQNSDLEREKAAAQFKQDIRKHIGDIADKYIIPGETSDGAVMFIPAEAVFAEIHAHYPELVEDSNKRRVWMVSPTTMMAILTTARAVLKDAATREQVHIIQQHLGALSKDFGRFQERMNKLSLHIGQANKDVELINTSARKITSRFEKIEKVELEESAKPELPIGGESDVTSEEAEEERT
jgi:DNA recombination protein RmuC